MGCSKGLDSVFHRGVDNRELSSYDNIRLRQQGRACAPILYPALPCWAACSGLRAIVSWCDTSRHCADRV
jgi:hypothetical protein